MAIISPAVKRVILQFSLPFQTPRFQGFTITPFLYVRRMQLMPSRRFPAALASGVCNLAHRGYDDEAPSVRSHASCVVRLMARAKSAIMRCSTIDWEVCGPSSSHTSLAAVYIHKAQINTIRRSPGVPTNRQCNGSPPCWYIEHGTWTSARC